MSHKHTIHGSDFFDLQAKHHSRNLFVVIAVAFLAILVIALVTIQPKSVTVSNNASSEVIPHTNGMAMQYAQPWLDKQAAAAAPARVYPPPEGMARQYAQPWLDKQAAAAAPARVYPPPEGMARQYAQPWLDK
jgi:hypothetical protein